MSDLVIRARRAVLPDGIRPAEVRISAGRITSADPAGAATVPGSRPYTVNLGTDEVLLPGLVDTHVHVNEPGRTEWEGFATATAAAAAGGVTTLLDMPLNSVPPTVTPAALAVKRAAAQEHCQVDAGFWGGAVPGNEADLAGLHEAGVFGFKCFLTDSGVPEFPPLDRAGLQRALAVVARLGSVLVVHAEDPAVLATAPEPRGRGYASFLNSRPPDAEVAAVRAVIEAARRTGGRAHILHLSAAQAVPVIAAARQDGVPVSAETCPHYLTFAAEDVPDGGTEFKCCPPIRDAVNRERLWEALEAGIIGTVASDHSPCPPGLKQRDSGDFGAAWGGVSGLQLALPAVWTVARERGIGLDRVAAWMAGNPAELAGLASKGKITAGCDADLVAFAPEQDFTVDPDRLRHRHKLTPYAGLTLRGVVRRTWLRGRPVYPDAGGPLGRLLCKTPVRS
jgi:allantoinase